MSFTPTEYIQPKLSDDIKSHSAVFSKSHGAVNSGLLKSHSAVNSGFLKSHSAVNSGFLKSHSASEHGRI